MILNVNTFINTLDLFLTNEETSLSLYTNKKWNDIQLKLQQLILAYFNKDKIFNTIDITGIT